MVAFLRNSNMFSDFSTVCIKRLLTIVSLHNKSKKLLIQRSKVIIKALIIRWYFIEYAYIESGSFTATLSLSANLCAVKEA